MSFNALAYEAEAQRNYTASELMEWLKNSGYADKVSHQNQPFTPRIVDRRSVPAVTKRYSAIKGL